MWCIKPYKLYLCWFRMPCDFPGTEFQSNSNRNPGRQICQLRGALHYCVYDGAFSGFPMLHFLMQDWLFFSIWEMIQMKLLTFQSRTKNSLFKTKSFHAWNIAPCFRSVEVLCSALCFEKHNQCKLWLFISTQFCSWDAEES